MRTLTYTSVFSVILFCFILCLACNNPDKTVTAVSADSLKKQYHLENIKLPPGFEIAVYAQVPNARSMCWGAHQTLFIGNKDKGNVYAVVDEDNDGYAEKVYTIDSNLNTPNGVAFKDGNLYVAELNRIIRFDNIESKLANPPSPVVVFDKLPSETQHGWRFIAFGPDGKLYIPVGAPCNICEPTDSIFGTINRMNADGTGFETYARGIRNSVGFTWQPQSKELWFTDNGRDLMGDDIPFCELNYAPQQGMNFGFPYCHEGDILDPQFGKGKSCNDYVPPAKKLGPHVAPLGLRFYTGNMFGDNYKNKLFIAEHGSWNRSVLNGYRVGIATLNGNQVVDYKPFAEGWLQPDSKVNGRPVDIEVAPDGALLVSDDFAGAIYRITYKK